MPLPVPRLDDRTFADLVEQARGLIPSYAPDWTDHNASDPGIALLELFAWLVEMLVFRADQVPATHRVVFLRLLNGPGYDLPPLAPGQSPDALVEQEIRAAVLRLRDLQQAITDADYAELAARAPGTARALAVGGKDLGAGDETGRAQPRAGYVSIVVVPDDPQLLAAQLDADALERLDALVADIETRLDGYRMLTTQLSVVTPLRSPVSVRALIARRADVRAADLEAMVADALRAFLDPLTGGLDGRGWPFGRSVYVSEVVQLLEGLDAVDHIPHVTLESHCTSAVTRCVEAPAEFGGDGELVRLALEPHHLPLAAGIAVTSATAFARVTATVEVPRPAGEAPDEVRRRTREALRAALEPPGLDARFPETGSDQRRTIGSDELLDALGDAGVAATAVALSGAGVTRDAAGVTTLITGRDELVDVRPQVEVT